jgi:hypothetical protein
MMEVMKLPDVCESSLEHLTVSERGDGFETFRVESLYEAIHQLAPGPKAIPGRSASLGETRQTALKSMAVHVRQARDTNGVTLIGRGRDGVNVDAPDASIDRCQPDSCSPAFRQQCRLEPQSAH